MAHEPLFEGTLTWAGPNAQPFSYDTFDRSTRLEFKGGAVVEASAPGEFKGDDSKANPETLMLASLMQCHFLTFMAVASKSGTTVTSYSDQASGRLAMKDGKMRFVEVTLHPKVTFADPAHLAKLDSFHDKAHRNCFMANSVNFPVTVAADLG
jgi:organic hydroperoxide reductase OsmC/OhrA